MKEFIINEQQLQAVGGYLMKQSTGSIPFEQVLGLIQMLQSLPMNSNIPTVQDGEKKS